MIRQSFASETNEENLQNFSQCMESVGMHHKYQRNLLFIFFPYWIVASFFVFQQLYTFQQPKYRCLDQSLTEEQCKTLVCSSGFPFNKTINIVPQHTFTYQFDLFCQKDYIRVIYKLMPKVLPIVGYNIYGLVGDNKGRVVAFKISWRFFIIGCFFLSLTKTQILITFGYALASVSCLPTLALQFPLLFEESNRKFWGIGSMAIVAWQGAGQFVLSLMAESIIQSTSSSTLLLCLCAFPSLACGFFLFYFVQSPRYLYGVDKIKALNILNKIASKNNMDRLVIDLKKSYWVETYSRLKPFNYAFMMYYPFLRVRLLVGMGLFFAARSAMTSSQIMLDQYLGPSSRGFVIGAATISGNILLCFTINKLPRNPQKLFVLLTISSAILLGLYSSVGEGKAAIPIIIFSSICRFISSIIYGMLLIWGVQTFPTVSRTTGYSFILMGTCLGTIANYSFRSNETIQLWLIAGISILAIPLCRLFPETFQKLPIDQLYSEKGEEQDLFYKY